MTVSTPFDPRLDALRQTRLLDSPPAERFDRLTRVAARALGVPVALVSLVDADRQFFKSCFGLSEPWATTRQTALSHSFCQHVVNSRDALVIEDARAHPLVRDNLAIAELGVVAYAGFPLTTDDGHVVGSFCAIDTKPRAWSTGDLDILRDLAASASAEIGLKRERDAAQAANRSKDRFLAVLSHELRMPLSPALLLAAALAADEALPREVRDDASTIQRNIELQTRLIDDLLDVTRIENGKLSLDVQPLDAHALLGDAVALCAGDAAGKGVTIAFDSGARRPDVLGDPVRLRQVFANLLKNAVKFSAPGGRVILGTSDTPDGRFQVCISDTGVGIDPALLHAVFEPFEQGARTVTGEFSGLGLGLAIAKGLTEGHGGSIRAASEGRGRGTTMTVELPVSPTPAPARPARPARPADASRMSARPGTDARPLRILLVDDHRDTLNAMSRLLRSRDYHVSTAGSVAAALAVAEAEPFDVLISDIGLPDGTGLDLMRHLLKRRPIIGIALSGYGTASDIQQTREAGYTTHLTKPIDLRRLEAALDCAAGRI